QWALAYPAQLKPSVLLDLPGDFQLLGNLAHRTVEQFYHQPDAIGWPVERVREWFDAHCERIIEEEGAVLLMRGRRADREAFRLRFRRSLTELHQLLQAAATPLGTLKGTSDLLLSFADGGHAIIDMKWAGNRKYRGKLMEQSHTQLAIYARLIEQNSSNWPAVSYFILSQPELLTTAANVFPGVIATSFTNKSAAELRERVRAHLIGKGRYTLATAIGQSRIGTVNSICGNLLARFAFEAGLPPEQQVLDEARAGLLLSESMDEVIEGQTLTQLLTIVRRLGLADPPFGQDRIPWKRALEDVVSQARANAIDPDRLRLSGDRNADALLEFFPPPSGRDLDAALRAAIEVALPPIRRKAAEGGPKNTANYLELLERAARDLDAGELGWAQWNALASREPQAALRPVVQAVKELAACNAAHPTLHQDIRVYLRTIFKLAADVLEIYRARKRQLGVIDFTDQERELLNIIDLPAVAETLREELDLVMVDEFQDTSPIQLALFLKLGRLAKHVVWVGDVKQAIYGFRDGDARLMTAVLGKLGELRGEKEVLRYSWRSRPSLVALVNELFADAFPDLSRVDLELQPRRVEPAAAVALEDWQLGGNATGQQHGIAAGIAALIAERTLVVDRDTNELRPLRRGDIAILAKSNHTVRELAAVLRSRNIAAATAQPGLLQCPEIVLALACLRRLNDERDTIATAEIVSLADCEDPDRWLAERLAWLDAGASADAWREQGDDALPIFRAIRALRAHKPLLSPREAVELVSARPMTLPPCQDFCSG
ncbi:MAG: UvrD-helicase domain-containing protein, partial [Steroidobacteraceae bacterium]|nr:UvrD-helicase domain-containing protein [Steroidobacteraceae bacterium]